MKRESQPVAGKHVLLGVTGGIAAYKSCELVRLLTNAGAAVRVVMTATAQKFVGPLTFQALSGNPVHTDLFDPAQEAAMGHIALARWADVVVVAPATADFVARAVHGAAPDLLSTLLLATTAPLVVAPAMNTQMWRHPATQANVVALRSRPGVTIVGPGAGDLACGETGPGRMSEPAEIFAAISDRLVPGDCAGLKILVTAGPTVEPLDPVRYITNRSSGKMGFAVARRAAERGAAVTLVAGPVRLDTPAGVNRVDVKTADEMYKAVTARAKQSDVVVMAAAIADYRPLQVARQKIKKSRETMDLVLTRNPDILAALQKLAPQAIRVGFAAETNDVAANAQKKLAAKGCHLLVANDVTEPGSGFDHDTNRVTIYARSGKPDALPRLAKIEVADVILTKILSVFSRRSGRGRRGSRESA